MKVNIIILTFFWIFSVYGESNTANEKTGCSVNELALLLNSYSIDLYYLVEDENIKFYKKSRSVYYPAEQQVNLKILKDIFYLIHVNNFQKLEGESEDAALTKAQILAFLDQIRKKSNRKTFLINYFDSQFEDLSGDFISGE